MNNCFKSSYFPTLLTGEVFRPQTVSLTFGYRKRNQKKIRRLRRQGVKA